MGICELIFLTSFKYPKFCYCVLFIFVSFENSFLVLYAWKLKKNLLKEIEFKFERLKDYLVASYRYTLKIAQANKNFLNRNMSRP